MPKTTHNVTPLSFPMLSSGAYVAEDGEELQIVEANTHEPVAIVPFNPPSVDDPRYAGRMSHSTAMTVAGIIINALQAPLGSMDSVISNYSRYMSACKLGQERGYADVAKTGVFIESQILREILLEMDAVHFRSTMSSLKDVQQRGLSEMERLVGEAIAVLMRFAGSKNMRVASSMMDQLHHCIELQREAESSSVK